MRLCQRCWQRSILLPTPHYLISVLILSDEAAGPYFMPLGVIRGPVALESPIFWRSLHRRAVLSGLRGPTASWGFALSLS